MMTYEGRGDDSGTNRIVLGVVRPMPYWSRVSLNKQVQCLRRASVLAWLGFAIVYRIGRFLLQFEPSKSAYFLVSYDVIYQEIKHKQLKNMILLF